jgi:hypothetical protein
MTKCFAPVPLRRPEDARPFLRDPERHWRDGYSAAELAKSWIAANDIPAPVRAVLDSCDGYRGASLVAAFFEKQVDLGTPGGASQTDIMAIVAGDAGLAMIAVEGKVEESFDRVVSDWLKQSRRDDGRNRQARLGRLCELLGLAVDRAMPLRYQLLHRAAAAVLEASRYRAVSAMMLVHSFSSSDTSLPDFLAFAEAAGMPVSGKNEVSRARLLDGLELRLAWVADRPAMA